MTNDENQPRVPADATRDTTAALRHRYRISQFAVLLALLASGILVWKYTSDRESHERRMQEFDELTAEARAQRDQATRLLRRAQELFKATAAPSEESAGRAGPQESPPAPGGDAHEPANSSATDPDPAGPTRQADRSQ